VARPMFFYLFAAVLVAAVVLRRTVRVRSLKSKEDDLLRRLAAAIKGRKPR